jgi:hypothetical protein
MKAAAATCRGIINSSEAGGESEMAWRVKQKA